MTKRKKVWLWLISIAVLILVALWFLIPRPVIRNPETTEISYIMIQRHPYYQKEASDFFEWRPQTPEDQEIAKEIIYYLSQSKERRTLRKNLPEHPLSWKCMYIVFRDTRQSTFSRERGVLIAPRGEETFLWQDSGRALWEMKVANLSYCSLGTGFWGQLQGNLLDPDGIRAFVLNALELPEDFLG